MVSWFTCLVSCEKNVQLVVSLQQVSRDDLIPHYLYTPVVIVEVFDISILLIYKLWAQLLIRHLNTLCQIFLTTTTITDRLVSHKLLSAQRIIMQNTLESLLLTTQSQWEIFGLHIFMCKTKSSILKGIHSFAHTDIGQSLVRFGTNQEDKLRKKINKQCTGVWSE